MNPGRLGPLQGSRASEEASRPQSEGAGTGTLIAMEGMFVTSPPPNPYVKATTPQCDGIRRWGSLDN